jgi:hypothetical protein
MHPGDYQKMLQGVMESSVTGRTLMLSRHWKLFYELIQKRIQANSQATVKAGKSKKRSNLFGLFKPRSLSASLVEELLRYKIFPEQHFTT